MLTGAAAAPAGAVAADTVIPLPARQRSAARLGAAPQDELAVSASVRSLLASRVAFRWAAVVIGLALTSGEIAAGSYRPVAATAMCIYLTTWRSMRPLPLGSPRLAIQALALSDMVFLGVAIGLTDALSSPFAFSLLTAAGIAALGWGQAIGLTAVAVGTLSAVATALVVDGPTGLTDRGGQAVGIVMVLSVVVLGALRTRFIEAERRRVQLSGQVEALTEANDLLQLLNRVARTLPALEIGTALEVAERQIVEALSPRAFALLVPVENTDLWRVVRSKGLRLAETVGQDSLPWLGREALEHAGPVLLPELGARATVGDNGSGMAITLRGREDIIGLVLVEHATPGEYSEHHARLLEGLAEAIALTLDNATQFRRLRLLSATEERTRIARDLHDRLGQWLTFITIELERIQGASSGSTNSELAELRGTVQQAVDEFRETLRQLRTAVDERRPLAVVGAEVALAFERRTGIKTSWECSGEPPLAPIVENEVLRIFQEGLTNVEKHAAARRITAGWRVDERGGQLVLSDDGKGFDTSLRREGHYGLVGMNERASIISADLKLASTPGAGTTLKLMVPREVPT